MPQVSGSALQAALRESIARQAAVVEAAKAAGQAIQDAKAPAAPAPAPTAPKAGR